MKRRNLRWEVAINGRTRPMIDWLCTKERAVDHAIECARELADQGGHAVVVAITTPDGGVERELVVDGSERERRGQRPASARSTAAR